MVCTNKNTAKGWDKVACGGGVQTRGVNYYIVYSHVYLYSKETVGRARAPAGIEETNIAHHAHIKTSSHQSHAYAMNMSFSSHPQSEALFTTLFG